jgi:hypothetical protein
MTTANRANRRAPRCTRDVSPNSLTAPVTINGWTITANKEDRLNFRN